MSTFLRLCTRIPRTLSFPGVATGTMGTEQFYKEPQTLRLVPLAQRPPRLVPLAQRSSPASSPCQRIALRLVPPSACGQMPSGPHQESDGEDRESRGADQRRSPDRRRARLVHEHHDERSGCAMSWIRISRRRVGHSATMTTRPRQGMTGSSDAARAACERRRRRTWPATSRLARSIPMARHPIDSHPPRLCGSRPRPARDRRWRTATRSPG